MEFVGKTVTKDVEGIGILSGTVKSYDSSSGFVEIVYENGHSEELDSSHVASLLEPQPERAKPKPRVGRKPKKRRRVDQTTETGAPSGNVTDNLVAEDTEFKGILQGNASVDGNLGVCGGLGSEFEMSSGLGNGNGGSLVGNLNASVKSNGSEVTLGKGNNGFEESFDKGGSANGVCVKGGLDLNARLNLNEDLNLNDGCSSPLNNTEGSLKRRDSIDLNLDVNNENDVDLNVGYLGCSGGETLQRECMFDLNVEVCEEVKEAQGDVDRNGHSEVDDGFGKMRQLQEEQININKRSIEDDGVCGNLNDVSNAIKLEVIHVSTQHAAKDAVSVKHSDYMEVQKTDSPSETGFAIIHEYQDDPGSPHEQGSCRRKRRKLLDNLKTTPETVLRRSSRRASARKQVSSTIELQAMDDHLLSVGPSSLTEEKPVISGYENYEQCNVPPPKLQLPPSSQNLNLDDVPVLEFFSIYAFLRSFSTLLFLSPFELEDLVAALKSETPSILFDSIHVSILQTLKKHLEYLSNEGCQSASDCLRYIYFNFNMFGCVIHISYPFLCCLFNAGILTGICWT